MRGLYLGITGSRRFDTHSSFGLWKASFGLWKNDRRKGTLAIHQIVVSISLLERLIRGTRPMILDGMVSRIALLVSK
jgi:hypothetical protein